MTADPKGQYGLEVSASALEVGSNIHLGYEGWEVCFIGPDYPDAACDYCGQPLTEGEPAFTARDGSLCCDQTCAERWINLTDVGVA